MLVQRLPLTTSSLAFVRLPMLRRRLARSGPERSLAGVPRGTPVTPRTEISFSARPSPALSAADRASARTANSTPQKLGRPHCGYPVAPCLEAALLRPTMAQSESLEGVRDLDTQELASDVYGNPRQACTWARSPGSVSARCARDAANASYMSLYTGNSCSLSRN